MPREHGGQSLLRQPSLRARQHTEPARCRHVPGEHGRQRRLIERDDDMRAGQPAPHVGDMGRHPVRQRFGDVAHRARVGQRLVAAGQLERGRQRPRAGDLHLHRPGVVAAPPLRSASRSRSSKSRPRRSSRPGPVDQPPAGRLQIDVQVGQEQRAAADQIGARPAVRQLRKVRQIREARRSTSRQASTVSCVLPGGADESPAGSEPTPVAAPGAQSGPGVRECLCLRAQPRCPCLASSSRACSRVGAVPPRRTGSHQVSSGPDGWSG